MNPVQLDSDVRMPRPKYVQRDHERRRKLFKRYADAHEAAYVIRPTKYTVREDGFMCISDASGRICEMASEGRIKIRIKQMQERIKDR